MCTPLSREGERGLKGASFSGAATLADILFNTLCATLTVISVLLIINCVIHLKGHRLAYNVNITEVFQIPQACFCG